jgi:hypothetical protein
MFRQSGGLRYANPPYELRSKSSKPTPDKRPKD